MQSVNIPTGFKDLSEFFIQNVNCKAFQKRGRQWYSLDNQTQQCFYAKKNL